jgi:hypothetical protein
MARPSARSALGFAKNPRGKAKTVDQCHDYHRKEQQVA